MTIPWAPVVVVDIAGAALMLVIALTCARESWNWSRSRREDIFRHYIFLLTVAVVFFALSRSVGHIVKQVLLMRGMGDSWLAIAPFSGAINSASFVVIFAFGIYYQRFQRVHREVERYKNHLEQLVADRTADLERTNEALHGEVRERLLAEEGLRESKTVLESVFNSANPLCITSLDKVILDGNEAYFAIWPRSRHPSEPVKCFNGRPGALCGTERCPLTLIAGGEEEVVCEVAKEVDGGQQRTYIVTARPYRNAAGELAGIVESFQDITERKRAEQALADEKERLTVTLRSIGDAVITTDTDGRVGLMNRVAEELTGWSQQDAFGRHLGEVFAIVDGQTREPLGDTVARVLVAGESIELEGSTLLVSADGRERIIAVSGAPIRDQESRIIGVVLVFRDITERAKMEESLLKVKKLESVGVLAGGIAHDFNNILTAVIGNLDLARERLGPGHGVLPLLDKAEKASLQARDLTSQLLTFSKGGEPVKEASSIAEVIRDSAAFVLHGGKVVCRYDIPDDLWLTEIDRSQMSQVIQNLIINAAHAMPDGGRIDIVCRNLTSGSARQVPHPERDYVQVSIRDTGVGIPEKYLDRIFDPYFSTKKEGSGLGLAITHSIVAKHGGQISVDSRPGEGTAFHFVLPAAAEGTRAARECRDAATLRGEGRS